MNKQTEIYLLTPVGLEQIFEANGRNSFNKTGVDVENHGAIRASIKLWDKVQLNLPYMLNKNQSNLSGI